MNKHLAKLLSGYQDMVDRYGHDDALVQDLKAEIDRCQQAEHSDFAPDRRHNSSLADAWERHSEIASL